MVDFVEFEELAQDKCRLDEKMKEFRGQAIDEIISLLGYVRIFSPTDEVVFNGEELNIKVFFDAIIDTLEELSK